MPAMRKIQINRWRQKFTWKITTKSFTCTFIQQNSHTCRISLIVNSTCHRKN